MLTASVYAGGYPVGPKCAAVRGLLPGHKGKREKVTRSEQLDLFSTDPEKTRAEGEAVIYWADARKA